jgi:hypothetical protein
MRSRSATPCGRSSSTMVSVRRFTVIALFIGHLAGMLWLCSDRVPAQDSPDDVAARLNLRQQEELWTLRAMSSSFSRDGYVSLLPHNNSCQQRQAPHPAGVADLFGGPAGRDPIRNVHGRHGILQMHTLEATDSTYWGTGLSVRVLRMPSCISEPWPMAELERDLATLAASPLERRDLDTLVESGTLVVDIVLVEPPARECARTEASTAHVEKLVRTAKLSTLVIVIADPHAAKPHTVLENNPYAPATIHIRDFPCGAVARLSPEGAWLSIVDDFV